MPEIHTHFSPRFLLDWIETANPYLWKGFMYAGVMFVAANCVVLFMHHHLNIGYTTGMRIRTALTAAIYRKVMITVSFICCKPVLSYFSVFFQIFFIHSLSIIHPNFFHSFTAFSSS